MQTLETIIVTDKLDKQKIKKSVIQNVEKKTRVGGCNFVRLFTAISHYAFKICRVSLKNALFFSSESLSSITHIFWAFPFGSGYALQWLVRTSQPISTAIPNAVISALI
jgi:hypothetical protein